MLGKDKEKQLRFMFVNMDDFVPQDHILRAIKRTIDFSFIYDKVKELYSSIGRRSVDPVLLVKMLLIGYWYGIPSERRLGGSMGTVLLLPPNISIVWQAVPLKPGFIISSLLQIKPGHFHAVMKGGYVASPIYQTYIDL